MKVLVIDPWCSDSYQVYTIGLCDGLSKYVELTLCCSFFETARPTQYKVWPLFFRYSDRWSRKTMFNNFRKIIRGLEYFFAYTRILKHVKREQYDVIHIQWQLFYAVDSYFLRRIRMYTKKLVFTSHNVIPHINGKKAISMLRHVHRYFDVILVHGDRIYNEYISYFPEDKRKLYIQRHGVHLSQSTQYDVSKVSDGIKSFLEQKHDKVVSFVGGVFYNKGADRVLNFWQKYCDKTDNLLIVAGRVVSRYKELDSAVEATKGMENVFYLPRFLSDDEFSYILSHSNLIALPYRHASMSGIIYSAAAFAKTVVYTDTGALSEYVNKEDCFCADNSEDGFDIKLQEALSTPKNKLVEMGKDLHTWIYSNYQWDHIALDLLNEVYK